MDDKLFIYEGCYARLRNGRILGPLTFASKLTDETYQVACDKDSISWTRSGRYNIERETLSDIMRVLSPLEFKILKNKAYGKIAGTAFEEHAIPSHVMSAAMDAGIKAKPAYEEFVRAILEAGLAAQGESVQMDKRAVDRDELANHLSMKVKGEPIDNYSDTAQETLRKFADGAIEYFAKRQFPQNESENRIQESEKPKRGLSDFTIAPDLIAIALDEAEREFTRLSMGEMHIPNLSFRSLCIRVIHDLIKTEAAKYMTPAATVPPKAFPFKGYDLGQIGSALRHFLVGLGESRGLTLKGVWLQERHKLEATFVDADGAETLLKLEVPIGFEFPWRISESEQAAAAILGIISRKQQDQAPILSEVDNKITGVPPIDMLCQMMENAVLRWRRDHGADLPPPILYLAKELHAELTDIANTHEVQLS